MKARLRLSYLGSQIKLIILELDYWKTQLKQLMPLVVLNGIREKKMGKK